MGTHRLQPLDVAFFKPLQSYFVQAQDSWLRAHVGQGISAYNISELISEAATVGTAENAFKAAVERQIEKKIPKHKIPEDEPTLKFNSQAGLSSSTIVSETHKTPEDKAPPISNSQAGPSSSPILSEVSPNTFNKSLEELCTLPKNSEVSGNTKKRYHTSSAVELTSTPHKDELVVKKRRKEKSEKSKINKKSKKSKEAIQNQKMIDMTTLHMKSENKISLKGKSNSESIKEEFSILHCPCETSCSTKNAV
ncbi:hypothetical protein JTB14_007453 [Gonioctena quinquepunctata]|nr:hypothetical protein JTB14_007453 [Gonioctena quinquepunctata]